MYATLLLLICLSLIYSRICAEKGRQTSTNERTNQPTWLLISMQEMFQFDCQTCLKTHFRHCDSWPLSPDLDRIISKCSAVAEMGNRLATIDIGRKLGGCAPLPFLGGDRPHLTQCGLGRGRPPNQVASGSIKPFGHNRYGQKMDGCAPLGRGNWVPI